MFLISLLESILTTIDSVAEGTVTASVVAAAVDESEADVLSVCLTVLLHDAACFAVQLVVGFVEGAFYFLRVAQRLAKLLQFFLFVGRLKARFVQFVPLETQEILIAAAFSNVVSQLFQPCHGLLVFAISRLVGISLVAVVGNNVNHVKLEILLVEQKILVLAGKFAPKIIREDSLCELAVC